MDATETHEGDGYIVLDYDDLWSDDRACRIGRAAKRQRQSLRGVPLWKRKH